jgi:hypothetical protein
VSWAWDREDVASIIAGVFDLHVKLDVIARTVVAIHDFLGEDDEKEESPEND